MSDTTYAHSSKLQWQKAAWIRRGLLTLTVFTQTAIGTYFMRLVLPYHGNTVIEFGLLALFAILFTWISVGFWIGLTGFMVRRCGGDRYSLCARYSAEQLRAQPLAATAIVMPVYHESVNRSLGGLRTVYKSLEATGAIEKFDFFILSDSRNPEYWLTEQSAWYELCKELNAFTRLFYRRRSLNMNYKSGNIADFLRRWGRRYEYMIVLDADSLMAGETLLQLVRLMQAEPQVGIIQTNPVLINAKSLFSRAQQFSNQLYGPLFSAGLAAYQLGEAAYWGHNAIIRVDAFMRHCGLKRLPGRGLFGGAISSHDFVEAAYMARGGYEIWLEPTLGQSFEESPPTLMDDLKRDKRWAKGNLQHLWLLFCGKNLRFAHRMAFLNGVMSYLASPLWFLFLLFATVETANLVLVPINYFPGEYNLHPLWPEWNPQWALTLSLSILFLLFFPKLLAIVDTLLCKKLKSFGGFFAVTRSVLLEIIISSMLAPIRMLSHSRFVVEALLNVTLRWSGQNRTESTSWIEGLKNQAPSTLLALVWAGFAGWLDTQFLLWSLPVAIPLIIAAPLSVLLSRSDVGASFQQNGFLLTHEEIFGNPLISCLDEKDLLPPQLTARPAFVQAILNPLQNKIHGAFARSNPQGVKQKNLENLRRCCLLEGPDRLTINELSTLAQHPHTLKWLHDKTWRSAPDSYWGIELAKRTRQTPSIGKTSV
jgi:membrane glycosyltransferase